MVASRCEIQYIRMSAFTAVTVNTDVAWLLVTSGSDGDAAFASALTVLVAGVEKAPET